MKLTKKILYSLSFLSLLMITACSKSNLVSTSNMHAYNNDFGLVENVDIDNLLLEEDRISEQENLIVLNSTRSNNFQMEPNTFLAEDYVPSEPVISYKYKFDPKFYSHAEWRIMDLQ